MRNFVLVFAIVTSAALFSGCRNDTNVGGTADDTKSAATPTPSGPTSAGIMSNFLWKPEADSDYNKGNPVIHSNPCARLEF